MFQPGKPRVDGQTTAGAPAGSSAYAAQTSSTSSDSRFANLPDLPKRIIEFIVTQPSAEEGVHVAAIARAIGGDALSIRYALALSSWLALMQSMLQRGPGQSHGRRACVHNDRRVSLQGLIVGIQPTFSSLVLSQSVQFISRAHNRHWACCLVATSVKPGKHRYSKGFILIAADHQLFSVDSASARPLDGP
jgi:hypothetical protein